MGAGLGQKEGQGWWGPGWQEGLSEGMGESFMEEGVFVW